MPNLPPPEAEPDNNGYDYTDFYANFDPPRPRNKHDRSQAPVLSDRDDRRPSPVVTDDAGSRFAGLLRTVAKARPGQRNQVLYWAANRAREMAHARQLDPTRARDALTDAAYHVGLNERETSHTLDSAGLTAGGDQ